MLVWVTRDKGNGKDCVYMWDIKPKEIDDGKFDLTYEMALNQNKWSEYYYTSIFQKIFGFTPKKGSCQQMELSLTEIVE